MILADMHICISAYLQLRQLGIISPLPENGHITAPERIAATPQIDGWRDGQTARWADRQTKRQETNTRPSCPIFPCPCPCPTTRQAHSRLDSRNQPRSSVPSCVQYRTLCSARVALNLCCRERTSARDGSNLATLRCFTHQFMQQPPFDHAGTNALDGGTSRTNRSPQTSMRLRSTATCDGTGQRRSG